MPTIDRYLDLSTAHLTEEVARSMVDEGYVDVEGDEAVTYMNVSCREGVDIFGHIMPVDSETDPGWPECIRDCMDYARKLGCDYIRFDRDGATDPDLRHYEWSNE